MQKFLLVLGLLATVSAFLIFIYVNASAQGLDGLYWMRWTGVVFAVAIPVLLIAGVAVMVIIHAPAEKFMIRKDKTQ